ncbi:LemA family protein [Campylobacter sp. MIT 21-1685]|uniref:LemA family protein n=1 Tax=unclassified Campylobacter TaxID=2593542 RepID=UPI00224AAC7E|nr:MULTISPECIES: LemA family protein [unclassified Campylobacter]MCX2683381.1 LemA family protein [Campylobacter sp. MIT 21-1684]MCX2751692.1 LemA family protein [Campylobacter sp. MIT 21-1682]MCX2807894.1 LemA family protein [Campylobacter sp. MIT 21-1685]
MSAFWIIVAIVFGTLFIFGILIISIYNQLVVLKNRAQNAFAQIDVQLKRRYDLIPNMIEVAKKYLSHEQETLTKVIEARNTAKIALESVADNNPDALNNLNKAESSLQNALKGFNITLEAYPDLKANTTMIQLNEELSSTENKVAFARQAYNDNVMGFNTYKQIFPNNFIAGFFVKFAKDLEMLEFDEKHEVLNQVPKVQF